MRTLIGLTGVILSAAILFGCGSGSSDDESATGPVNLRYLNVSPDAGLTDFYVNFQRAFNDVGYLAVSNYVQFSPGRKEFKVAFAGQSASLALLTAAIFPTSQYTALALNVQESMKILLLEFVTADLPDSGNVWIRIAHAATKAEPIDVYALKTGQTVQDVQPVLPGIPFTAASVFTELTAGNYQIVITRNGTKAIIYDAGSKDLASGSVSTMVLANLDQQGTMLTSLWLSER